jgi:polyisoprenoid-binding protein YceI
MFPLAACLILVTACADVGDAPRAQTGAAVDVASASGQTLAIDTSRSTINWKAAKVTRQHDGGFGTFEGTVTVADGAVTGVNVNIDTRSVWTDTGRLTGHLKSPDFFEVEAYPEATFEADRFESVDSTGATHLVTGNLSMHGQTHGVTFPATITVSGDTVMATADFIINRTDWAINYKGQADDLVEENVRLLLDIVAAPAGASAAPTGAAASE